MKIDISIQEYFEELKLMEEQYGQEEDLYPWVYMLLQMAECRKKELLGEWYKDVSIRDVHNAKKSSLSAVGEDETYWAIRWELTKRVGPPDMVILDKKNKILGCIEIKKIGQQLLEETKKLSIGMKESYQYILGYSRNNRRKDYIENDKQFMSENIKAENIKYEDKCKEIIIESEDFKKLEEVTQSILKNGSKRLIGKNIWVYNTKNLPAKEESNQLAGHLDKFKKVLFTNGLKFYFLRLREDKNIMVDELADLTELYTQFKVIKQENNNDKIPEFILNADKEWKKLIAGLTNIKWHSDSKTKIIEEEPITIIQD